jgi:hypothetical protein
MAIERLILKNGGMKDFWISNHKVVEQFITSQKLQPATEYLIGRKKLLKNSKNLSKKMVKKIKKRMTFDPSIYGGIRVAHLHFKDGIYILNENQWKEFSNQIMENYRSKLAKVNTISFDNLMDLSDSIEQLP